MPIPTRLLAEFSEENYYHVICKCIEGKKFFYNDGNRFRFLKRYDDLLNDFADTYAYTLMDNHVHWLIKTKSEEDIRAHLRTIKSTRTQKSFLDDNCSFHELLEQQFNRLFISYSLSLNKSRNTTGHLFSRPFKRIDIADDFHLTQLIIYIHANIKRHQISDNFQQYKWSSYRAILSQTTTHIKRKEVLEWFGGEERFVSLHETQADFYYPSILSGE
jgi:REP element-mobilizing transposase RayT